MTKGIEYCQKNDVNYIVFNCLKDLKNINNINKF